MKLTNLVKSLVLKRKELSTFSLFSVLTTFGFVLLFIYFHYLFHIPLENGKSSTVLVLFELSPSSSLKSSNMTCKLPNLNPWDNSILQFIHNPPKFSCESSTYPRIFRTDFDSKLMQVGKFENLSCCYRVHERKHSTDILTRSTRKCFKINQPITPIPPLHEFIQVFCNYTITRVQAKKFKNTTKKDSSIKLYKNFTDFFAFVPIKKSNPPNLSRPNRPNVLILGLDSVSKLNFQRQMPLTHNYLMQNLSSIKLDGYTKVGDNTFPNLVPLLTGLSVKELMDSRCWTGSNSYFDSCPFLWKSYKKAAYVTSYAEDSIWMSTFQYEKQGFWSQPTDYYFHPFAYAAENIIGHLRFGNSDLCYGSRLSFEVLLDYIVKTAVRFGGTGTKTNTPYFQLVWANSLFHDFLNFPQLGDELLFQTLSWLNYHGYFDNTILLIISDHGLRWGGIRKTFQGKIEERMPLAYLTFPKWWKEKFPKKINALLINSNRLTTPFDIHSTLLEALGKKEKTLHGLSLLSPIPVSRICSDAGINHHYCVCNSMEIISTGLETVKSCANLLISELNFKISNYSENCAHLKLYNIETAMRRNINENDENELDSIIQLVITTIPGKAIFEATFSIVIDKSNRTSSSNQIDFADESKEISRLDSYKNQSNCINDFTIEKYCYCIDKFDALSNVNKNNHF